MSPGLLPKFCYLRAQRILWRFIGSGSRRLRRSSRASLQKTFYAAHERVGLGRLTTVALPELGDCFVAMQAMLQYNERQSDCLCA